MSTGLAETGHSGETYGEIHRRDSALLHRECTADYGSVTGWSCGPIRDVIFDRKPAREWMHRAPELSNTARRFL